MDLLSIPQISISPAPPMELPEEPYSPFTKAALNIQQDEDSFRPIHLTPPPIHSKFIKPRSSGSPGSPSDIETGKTAGAGLDRARFEALLNTSSKPLPGAKKSADLRREVALKAHRNRQVERRALFLSKLQAPPSPTAATLPATPPESPAVFHYSLPSPGLVSPIAHYESLQEEQMDSCSPWVEQVDFKLKLSIPKPKQIVQPTTRSKQGIPSLEQISARLNNYRAARIFDGTLEAPTLIQPAPAPKKEQVVVGRLRMPIRSPGNGPSITVTDTTIAKAPKSPLLIATSDLAVTTLVVPRTKSVSPTELTRMNLLALNCREKRSSVMLNALRRRTLSGLPEYPIASDEATLKSTRRHSAPPDLAPVSRRKGFEHPILALPGAF